MTRTPFLLEAVATRVETRPESLWAWLMLATMLTGLTGLCTVQTDRMSSSSSSSSSSDSDEPARGGDAKTSNARAEYADAPLDVDVINRVFDEDRDWWPDVFFKLEKPRLRAGRRGEGRPPGRLGRLRAKFIVLRVLFPRRAPEQYESVYERLENIAKHRDSGASFKAYASALKTRPRARAPSASEGRGKETPKARRDDGAEG